MMQQFSRLIKQEANKWLTNNNLHKDVYFRLKVGNDDVTAKIAPQLISLEITDNLAFEADTLSIKLNDDGIQMPTRGIKISLELGFVQTKERFNADFIVDELNVSGPPDTLEIKATSANLRQKLNIRHDASFDNLTLGDLVAKIAAKHGLSYYISKNLADAHIAHADQTGESDASFLIRILEDFGGCLTIKQNQLLIFERGAVPVINDVKIKPVIIERSAGDSFSFSIFDRGNYTGVYAHFLDYAQPTKKSKKDNKAPAKKEALDNERKVLVGTDENVKTLGHTYKNEQNAMRAAKYHLEKLQRAACSFSISLYEARPDLLPGVCARVRGFKKAIDSELWQIIRISHSLSKAGGFTSSLELEKQLE